MDSIKWPIFVLLVAMGLMVLPAVEGIDPFKVAGRCISGWIPSLKTGAAVRQPFCSQLEKHLMLRLEFTKC